MAEEWIVRGTFNKKTGVTTFTGFPIPPGRNTIYYEEFWENGRPFLRGRAVPSDSGGIVGAGIVSISIDPNWQDRWF